MVCIYCGGELSVSNSRPQKSRNQIWRRRPCKACGAVFTSTEALDLSQAIMVVRKLKDGQTGHNGKLSPFNRDKLFISIYTSLQHRPTAITDARSLADTVISGLKPINSTVSSQDIAQLTKSALGHFDDAAVSHYAAFHKQQP